MGSYKDYAILLLSLTTVAGAIVAWRQQQELAQLRVPVTNIELPAEPKSLPIEPQSDELVSDVAMGPELERGPQSASAAEANPPARGDRRNRSRADFRAIMDRPEIQRLIAIGQKSSLDSRYSALFKSLALTPDQLETFKELLVEKRTALADIRSAAREEGINSRTDPATLKKLVADAQAEIDSAIRATVGEAGFARYENYEKTFPQRNVVNQLEQRLSYSATPLTPQQSEQMVAIIAANNQAAESTNVSTSPLVGGGPAPFQMSANGTRITDATINQALGVLAAPQIDALRQLQQEQEAQATLSAAMRNRSRETSSSPNNANLPSVNSPPPPSANRGPSGG